MDLVTRSLLNSILVVIFGSGLTFLATWFWFTKNAAIAKAKIIADEHAKTIARLTEVEQKLALVNQAVIPISTAFQAILIKELTHFHTPEMDALMVKIGPPNILTDEEAARLTIMLEERTCDMGPEISDSERDAAHILPAIIKRAKAEAILITEAEHLKMQLVTVTAMVGVTNVRLDDVPTLIPVPDSAMTTLAQIEANTAVSADALKAIQTRAADKLGTIVAGEHKDHRRSTDVRSDKETKP